MKNESVKQTDKKLDPFQPLQIVESYLTNPDFDIFDIWRLTC